MARLLLSVALVLTVVTVSHQYSSLRYPPGNDPREFAFSSFQIHNARTKECPHPSNTPAVAGYVVDIHGKSQLCKKLTKVTKRGSNSLDMNCAKELVGKYLIIKSLSGVTPHMCKFTVSGRIYCRSPLVLKGSSCVRGAVCTKGPDGRTCVTRCPGSSSLSGGRCHCNKGYKVSGNGCAASYDSKAWCTQSRGKFTYCHRDKADCLFHDMPHEGNLALSLGSCQTRCNQNCQCRSIQWRGNRCWLKSYACPNDKLFRGFFLVSAAGSNDYVKLRPGDSCP